MLFMNGIVYHIKHLSEYEIVFSILALSFNSHTTLNKILIASLFSLRVFFFHQLLFLQLHLESENY